MARQAEYIWIDGTAPTPLLRSKTKILDYDVEPPFWGFDGSSTNQATGESSDCMLLPVFTCPDPLRGGDNILVLCEVHLAIDGKAHPTNTRAACVKTAKKFASHEMIFGIEQEYTFLKLDGEPLGFPTGGFPAPQGPYYCGVGAGRVTAREIIEEHTQACIDAGLMIEGTNAEVMPGQWEFQIGAADAVTVSDHLQIARWLLHRIGEDFDVVVSLDPKPQKGDWNGAVQQVQLRRVEPRGEHPDSVAGAARRQGLRRRSSPERQLRSVHGDPPDHRDCLRLKGLTSWQTDCCR